jgi:NADH-quinone oxidoreductase subunit M
MASPWLLALLLLPWLGALVVAALGHQRAKLANTLALLAVAGCVVPLVLLGRGDDHEIHVDWIPSLGSGFSLGFDALALPFVANVLAVSFLAILYGRGYFDHTESVHAVYALILAFAASMLGTLLATDALLFFIFWELMLLTSSLLLLRWGTGDRVGPITLKYFIYTQAGSLLILAALARLVTLSGSASLAVISATVATLSSAEITSLGVLFIVGFCVKMAVFPLHTWLPDAHSVAPMPVTVMLAAAMLSMGTYGILRFPFQLLSLHTVARIQAPLMVAALLSEVYGALMCLASKEIKRIVAYSSVSQMGYILFGLASLTTQGVSGAILLVIAHGVVKASLFMGVGLIMRSTGRQHIDELGGLLRRMPRVTVGMLIGAVAIAGAPPFVGFHGEWLILSGGLASGRPLLGYLELLAPLLTAAYALWFVGRLALAPSPPGLETAPVPRAMSVSFWITIGLLALLGVWAAPLYAWADRAVALLALGG